MSTCPANKTRRLMSTYPANCQLALQTKSNDLCQLIWQIKNRRIIVRSTISYGASLEPARFNILPFPSPGGSIFCQSLFYSNGNARADKPAHFPFLDDACIIVNYINLYSARLHKTCSLSFLDNSCFVENYVNLYSARAHNKPSAEHAWNPCRSFRRHYSDAGKPPSGRSAWHLPHPGYCRYFAKAPSKDPSPWV